MCTVNDSTDNDEHIIEEINQYLQVKKTNFTSFLLIAVMFYIHDASILYLPVRVPPVLK